MTCEQPMFKCSPWANTFGRPLNTCQWSNTSSPKRFPSMAKSRDGRGSNLSPAARSCAAHTRSGFPSRPPSGITAALRWCIVAVGKPRLAYARAGVAEYLARLRCFSNVDTSHVRPSNPLREGGQLLSRSEGCFRLVLDERGKKLPVALLRKR